MADLRHIPGASVADRFYDVWGFIRSFLTAFPDARFTAAWNNAVGLLRWKRRYGEMTDDD